SGCGQSLFDSRGDTDGGSGGEGGGGDGPVANMCPAGCIGDAAGDFDGSPAGSTGRWRYLDDTRSRAWTAMTATGNVFTGAASNKITTCAEQSTAGSCGRLPGALLVSSSGAMAVADPALEFTVTADQVIQLTLQVHVPDGAVAQIVRVYRNSREDVLATTTAMAGVTLERMIPIDALAGDRLLVAIAPGASGAADVALHLYVSETGAVFPSNCQLALSFSAVSAANANAIEDRCGSGDATFRNFTADTNIPPQLVAGPFPEHGLSAEMPGADLYYLGLGTVPRVGDTTTQMWVRHDAFVDGNGAWVFSDEDLDAGGGLAIGIYNNGGVRTLEAVTCTNPGPLMFARTLAPWPASGGWHFVRVSHTNGIVSLCLDGQRVGSFPAPAGSLRTTYAPRYGRNSFGLPSGAWFDGGLDDIRLFNTALPCD
ncbi:MAG: LamG domain-containing protein, partial [Deltaproteobacteria bacterium]|nr:LamG domain-containing protein [Deltaproteobacteria bacterium]